jgi:hypothetical protein
MNYRVVGLALLACTFFCHAGVMRAQVPEAPVLPMEIKFRYVPQYFEQSFADDPRYARIEALVDEGRCDVILLDKTTNREVFYSTSILTPDAVAANGGDAYTVQIDVTTSSTVDSYALFVIHFHDQFGQEITWQFLAGEMVPHSSPEVISHTDSSGVTLLYAPRRAAGVAGTTVTIAGRKHQPKSAQSSDALAAFYATDMTLGQILPGTDLWNVERSPAEMAEAAEWDLGGVGGQQRNLVVKEFSETQTAVEQIDFNDPDAPRVVLNLVRVNDAYEVDSLSFKIRSNRLCIFFGPSLPLPAYQVIDKRIVTFTIAENEQASIASGVLEVQRAVEAEHVLWRFETPHLTSGTTLETGVNLVPGTREQASCQHKDCSELR